MNMFKKNGGFTLVELIVVIAILAILAAVAVPAYTGYIAKAEQAGDLQLLSAVNTAVQGLAAAEGETIEKVTVTKAGAITILVEDADGATDASDTDATYDPSAVTEAEVKELVSELSFGSKFYGAKWENGEWELCAEDHNKDAACPDCGAAKAA